MLQCSSIMTAWVNRKVRLVCWVLFSQNSLAYLLLAGNKYTIMAFCLQELIDFYSHLYYRKVSRWRPVYYWNKLKSKLQNREESRKLTPFINNLWCLKLGIKCIMFDGYLNLTERPTRQCSIWARVCFMKHIFIQSVPPMPDTLADVLSQCCKG